MTNWKDKAEDAWDDVKDRAEDAGDSMNDKGNDVQNSVKRDFDERDKYSLDDDI